MKQIFLAKEGIKVEEVPPPICGDKEVLVQTRYSVISSGTEIVGLRKETNSFLNSCSKKLELFGAVKNKIKTNGFAQTTRLAKDRITGHERFQSLTPTGYSLSGIVLEKGNQIIDLNVGDRVACAGSKIACHAEIVSVPRNLVVKSPNNVDFKEAAFVTLGSIAMHGIRRAGTTFGDSIVILGLGLLGLLGLQIAKAAGCRVIGIDPEESRVEIARSLGANLALNPNEIDVEKEVSSYTNGMGADAAVIYAATGNSEPANQAMRMCRKKGRVVVVGDIGMELERQPMYEKEIDFLISTSYGPGRYDKLYEEKGVDYPYAYVKWTENRNMQEFLNMISEQKVNVNALISSEFSIEDAPRAYQSLLNSDKKPIAVLLKYPHSEAAITDSTFIRKVSVLQSAKTQQSDSEKINIGLIGAGSFAQRVHLPNLKKINSYNLRAVVNQHGEKAKMVAKRFDAQYATTDYREVLADEDVDAVLIGTRHNLHAAMTIEAAKAGKAVFVEKPMATNYTQLKDIQHIISQTGVNYTVGFNRRYSALALKAKSLLETGKKPYLIHYRVNAGFIPQDSWIQDPIEGGGRIIGECCHFFDLLNYFTDSEIEEIAVKCLPINANNVVAEDNFVTTLRYKDGSLATLTYVSIGNKSLPKERIEIFSAGSAIIINNFERMELYGFDQRNVELKKKDKGQYNQLVEFLKLVKGEPSSCLTLDDAAKATDTTLKVVDMISKLNNQ